MLRYFVILTIVLLILPVLFYSMTQQTYKCTGYATAYTSCSYTNKNPHREKFVFPKDTLKEFKELSAIKATVGFFVGDNK